MPRLILALAVTLSLSGAALAQEVNTDPAAAPAGTYKLDHSHTSVTMRVSHMGLSYYTLRFEGVKGEYAFDPAHPDATKLDVTIDPASVDTGDAGFNKQVANQILEAEKFPQIHFVSTNIHSTSEGRGTVIGDLTFHGVTKPVTLDVIYNGFGRGMLREARMGFSATTALRRTDFGAGKYVPLVGDQVSVVIETEFSK
jgi:polyisoprenoid-binding protein YceI